MSITGSNNQGNVTALAKLWRALPIEIAKGNVDGYSQMNKFGENPAVSAAEDLWDFGGTYTFSTTADIDKLSSSDDSDTQSITVIGLDANWDEVIQTKTLTGQAKVTLDTPLIRVYRMYNNGSTDIAGVVYCYVDGDITAGEPDTDADVRAIINGSSNQTLMCVFTVPRGKTAYFLQGYIGISRRATAATDFAWMARPFGGVFRQQSRMSLNSQGSGTWQFRYALPPSVPEKTDIKIRILDTSAVVGVGGGFDVLMVDNE